MPKKPQSKEKKAASTASKKKPETVKDVVNDYLAQHFKEDFGTYQVMKFMKGADSAGTNMPSNANAEERREFLKRFVMEEMCPVGLTFTPPAEESDMVATLEDVVEQLISDGNTSAGSVAMQTCGEEGNQLLKMVAASVELHKNKTITDAQAKKATKIHNVAKMLKPSMLMAEVIAFYSELFDRTDYWINDNECEDEEFIESIKVTNTAVDGLLNAFDDEELGLVGCSRQSIKSIFAHTTSLFEDAAEDREVDPAELQADPNLWAETVEAVGGGRKAKADGTKRKASSSTSSEGLPQKRKKSAK